MPGFLGIISNERKNFPENFNLINKSVTSRRENIEIVGNCWFQRSITENFLKDKIFKNDHDFFCCTDGIFLNASKLIKENRADDLFGLIKFLYNQNKLEFPLQFRGDFSGVIYDKKQELWLIFNNHIGSKPVFYFYDENKKIFIFGCEFKMVLNGLKAIGIIPTLNEIGAYFLLTFGYMIGDETLVKEIKKLPPGSILKYQNGKININQYYKLNNTPYIEAQDEEIIEELHKRFSEAIEAEYGKDSEYGYNHIATLSGGLDSRQNVCYAKKLGISNLLTICFSQSNYLDEQISKKIASDWNYNYLFSSLDNGNYLKDIDTHVLVNDGLCFYAGAAHVYSMLRFINWTSFGLLHTGQIGDLIMGSYLEKPMHQDINEFTIKKVATSTKLMKRIPDEVLLNLNKKYSNNEIFAFYERCINGVFNGYRVIEQFSEYSSPFLYLDFLEYAIRIHPKKRYKEAIYIKWIQEKAPEAKKYIWEKTGFPIGTPGGVIFIFKTLKMIKNKIFGPSKNDSMNPFDYWYKYNPELRIIFEEYFNKHISLLDNYPQLKKDVNYLFQEGNTIEKTQVLTLLAAIKLHNLK